MLLRQGEGKLVADAVNVTDDSMPQVTKVGSGCIICRHTRARGVFEGELPFSWARTYL